MNYELEDYFPINYKGFLYRKANKALILNSSNYEKAIQIMQKDNIGHLEINANYLTERDVSFVSRFQFISTISIVGNCPIDISPIQSLENIKEILIDHKLTGKLDFSKFRSLNSCYFNWGIKGSETIFECSSLQKLRIDNISEIGTHQFNNFASLRELTLFNSKINNLGDLNNLENLRKLDLTAARKLTNIEDIVSFKNIEELRLDDCKNLDQLDSLKSLKTLKILAFNNIGEVESISSFDNLINLSEIYFVESTNILDGDLSCLESLYKKGTLKTILFRPRKHYSHKPQDLGYLR
jgi:hypothetical protein